MEDEAPVEAGELGDLLGDDADVVADEDEGDLALAIQVLEQRVEARLRLGIDAARRLVQDQKLGVRDQRAGDEDPLLLPGRQRADARAGLRGHADLAEHLGDAGALRRPDPAEQAERGHEARRHDLLDGGGEVGVEHGSLGHIAEAPPLPERRRRMTEEAHVPAIGRQQSQHDAQERRLAPAVRPDDAEEVTRVHGEVDALEDGQLAVTDVDVLELDEGPHRLSAMLLECD